ncbi:MAG: hypothetical protein WBL95_01605 [Microcoleus sp.]
MRRRKFGNGFCNGFGNGFCNGCNGCNAWMEEGRRKKEEGLNFQCPMPNSQFPMPYALCPMPYAHVIESGELKQ